LRTEWYVGGGSLQVRGHLFHALCIFGALCQERDCGFTSSKDRFWWLKCFVTVFQNSLVLPFPLWHLWLYSVQRCNLSLDLVRKFNLSLDLVGHESHFYRLEIHWPDCAHWHRLLWFPRETTIFFYLIEITVPRDIVRGYFSSYW
jgi:hypothetical protein